MKFLIDNSISHLVASGLRKEGHDAVHVLQIGLEHSDDLEIFHKAANEGRCLIAADTDFGAIVFFSTETIPSIILFRKGAERRPDRQLSQLLTNLEAIKEFLEKRSIIVFEPTRIRIRSLE